MYHDRLPCSPWYHMSTGAPSVCPRQFFKLTSHRSSYQCPFSHCCRLSNLSLMSKSKPTGDTQAYRQTTTIAKGTFHTTECRRLLSKSEPAYDLSSRPPYTFLQG